MTIIYNVNENKNDTQYPIIIMIIVVGYAFGMSSNAHKMIYKLIVPYRRLFSCSASHIMEHFYLYLFSHIQELLKHLPENCIHQDVTDDN